MMHLSGNEIPLTFFEVFARGAKRPRKRCSRIYVTAKTMNYGEEADEKFNIFCFKNPSNFKHVLYFVIISLQITMGVQSK